MASPRNPSKTQLKKRMRRTARGKVRLILRRLVKDVPAIAQGLTRGSQRFIY